VKKQAGFSPDQDYLEDMAKRVSVDEMITMAPDIKTYFVNFKRNPIQPNRWRTEPGGWMEWIRNGGYPLSDKVAHAQSSIVADGSLEPILCESILCQCPISVQPWPYEGGGDFVAGGQASCVPITLSKAAGVNTSGKWRPYVAIYQDMNNPLWELTLVYQDPAWYTKAAEFLGSWMEKLGKLYCGFLAPEVKKQLTKTTADSCVNAQGQACARGTPGCTCQAAPNASTTSAANTNIYTQAAMLVHGEMCEDWLEEYADKPPPPPPDPLPAFVPPPPELKKFKVTPTMIALGVAGLGAAVLLTRKRG
jgi:hypothetical protein